VALRRRIDSPGPQAALLKRSLAAGALEAACIGRSREAGRRQSYFFLQGGAEAPQVRAQVVEARSGAPRLEVDDVELLLGAEKGEVAHADDARSRMLRTVCPAVARRLVTPTRVPAGTPSVHRYR
jgi:hypothetical protein